MHSITMYLYLCCLCLKIKLGFISFILHNLILIHLKLCLATATHNLKCQKNTFLHFKAKFIFLMQQILKSPLYVNNRRGGGDYDLVA